MAKMRGGILEATGSQSISVCCGEGAREQRMHAAGGRSLCTPRGHDADKNGSRKRNGLAVVGRHSPRVAVMEVLENTEPKQGRRQPPSRRAFTPFDPPVLLSLPRSIMHSFGPSTSHVDGRGWRMVSFATMHIIWLTTNPVKHLGTAQP